jgi:hypothetical protein
MTEPALLWNYKPPPPVKPREGEPVWTMTKGAKRLICELRYHGEYGVEALMLLDGELHMGRRFPTRALAVDEASIMHAQCLEHGCQVEPELLVCMSKKQLSVDTLNASPQVSRIGFTGRSQTDKRQRCNR